MEKPPFLTIFYAGEWKRGPTGQDFVIALTIIGKSAKMRCQNRYCKSTRILPPERKLL
jgi:hypothetical protein